MNIYQVVRTHTSPYHAHNFNHWEKEMVEAFPGLQYKQLSQTLELPTILISNTHTNLETLPSNLLSLTKLIIHSNSGYDNYSNSHDLWKNIPVIVGHSIRAQGVAEYCLASLMEGLIKLPQHLVWDKDRRWERGLLKGTEVWIFGYGHIGRILADSLSHIGMNLTVVDPYVENCPFKLLKRWQEGRIDTARVVISVMGLNSKSYHLFNEDFFNSLGSEILFINPARGPLVDETNLKNYLRLNPDSFAFLDVFENEPFDETWKGHPQVWKTSHIAGVDRDLDKRILEFEQGVLENFLFKNQNEFLTRYEDELLQKKWIKGELI